MIINVTVTDQDIDALKAYYGTTEKLDRSDLRDWIQEFAEYGIEMLREHHARQMREGRDESHDQ